MCNRSVWSLARRAIGDSFGNNIDSFGTDVRGVAAASAAGASWEAVFVTPKEKLARLKVAERAALEVTTHRYCEDLSGLLELLGCV